MSLSHINLKKTVKLGTPTVSPLARNPNPHELLNGNDHLQRSDIEVQCKNT